MCVPALIHWVGESQVVLFPPTDLPNLYYVGRPKGALKYEYPATFTRDRSSVDPKAVVFGSSVNVDEPDLTRHPKYPRATPSRALLGPGDVLFLPAYWHHEVQSLPEDVTEVSEDLRARTIRKGVAEERARGGRRGGQDTSTGGLNVAVNFWFESVNPPELEM